MNEERKDLSYFQQQVAEEYKACNWLTLMQYINFNPLNYPYTWELHNKVAELYAAHRFQEGKQAGAAKALEANVKSYDNGLKNGELKGWNEALHWAAEETQIDFVVGNDLKQSILNGLKEE